MINCENYGDVTSGGYAASFGGFKSYNSTGKTYVYGHTNEGTVDGVYKTGITDSSGTVILGADGYGVVYDSNQYDYAVETNGAYTFTKK